MKGQVCSEEIGWIAWDWTGEWLEPFLLGAKPNGVCSPFWGSTRIFSKKNWELFVHPARLHVCNWARPKFFQPRPVPFAIIGVIDQELDYLESCGILKKVSQSGWAAPIVAVPKRDRHFRICGDYRVTVSQALDIDQYPSPRPDDLFATLSGGNKFSKSDLSQAYQQLILDEQSAKHVTIITQKGLYLYTCLPYGVVSAPAIFQRVYGCYSSQYPPSHLLYWWNLGHRFR